MKDNHAAGYRIYITLFVLLLSACSGGIPAGPEPREGAKMFYEPHSERILLIGGFSCEMAWKFEPWHYNDVWAYSIADEEWEAVGELNIPNATNFGYDSESGKVIFLTVANIETWSYDPISGEVQNLEPTDMPPDDNFAFRLYGADMAYDAESDRLILFGGGENPDRTFAGTWAYDYESNTWSNMQPEAGPPIRAFHQMVYDSESDRVLLWGGYPNLENDTSMWAYDYNTNTWENYETVNGPETHFERFGMVYHPPSDLVYIYSGFVEAYQDREEQFLEPATWTYDFNTNTWEQIDTEENPGQRMWYSLAYDESADKMILFGEEQTAKYVVDLTNAVWVFDFETQQWRDATVDLAGCDE